MSSAHTLRHIAAFLRPLRWRLVGIILLTALLSLMAMLPPLLTRDVINRVVGEGDRNRLFAVGATLIAISLLYSFCAYLQVVGVTYVGQTFVMRIRTAVYHHLLNLSIAFFGRNSTGMLTNRLMGDSTVLQQMLSVGAVQVISDLVCATFAISAAFFINWRLAIPLLVLVVLFAINYQLNIQRIRRATRGFREAEDRVASGVQNRLFANLTVRTYGTESREHNEFSAQSGISLGLMRDSQVATGVFTLNTMLLRDIGRITIYFLGCAMVLNGTANYGDVTAFTTYAMQLLMPAVRFSQLVQQFQNVRISADRLFSLLDEPDQILQRPNALILPRARGQVNFENVHFSYEPEKPVLCGITLNVQPGQCVALVGPTGCGKTTVLSLLMRLFDVKQGAIRIDQTDIRDVTLDSLRSQFGIVLQESLLFTVSIADNIRYGRRDASRAEIEQAARIAEIHEDILALPGGYDAEVGTRNVQLSVGQKQRLSIARAVLANPAILIMDEATSALDSNSERAIQIAMDRFLANRTAFIVAHRLSTIRNADQIVLLDRGTIREHGNHDELMALPDGAYRAMYNRHASRGIIAEEE